MLSKYKYIWKNKTVSKIKKKKQMYGENLVKN